MAPPAVIKSPSELVSSGVQFPRAKNTGINVIISPPTKGPIIAPQIPPFTLPKTPEVAPKKNVGLVLEELLPELEMHSQVLG